MAHQISVFAENKPGRIEKITRLLTEEKINIRAITISSANGFGVIKILPDQPKKGYDILRSNSIPTYLQEVIAVIIPDIPGGLHQISFVLNKYNLNIEDAYGFVVESGKKAVLILQVENQPQAQEILENNGFQLLSDEEIYRF